jgi:hypothetical protein
MLPGREFAYQSLWQDGELVAAATERVVYLYGFLTPSGQTSTPQIARTVSLPHVDAIAPGRSGRWTHPNGVYCVDIKESAGGVPLWSRDQCRALLHDLQLLRRGRAQHARPVDAVRFASGPSRCRRRRCPDLI